MKNKQYTLKELRRSIQEGGLACTGYYYQATEGFSLGGPPSQVVTHYSAGFTLVDVVIKGDPPVHRTLIGGAVMIGSTALPALKEIMPYINYVGLLVGGWLASRGYATQMDGETLAGILIAGVTLATRLIRKRKAVVARKD